MDMKIITTGKFWLVIWKKIAAMRVVEHWEKLHRWVVKPPSLEVLKIHVDKP